MAGSGWRDRDELTRSGSEDERAGHYLGTHDDSALGTTVRAGI